MQVYKCDRCKKYFETKSKLPKYTIKSMMTSELLGSNIPLTLDLCQECEKDLIDFIENKDN